MPMGPGHIKVPYEKSVKTMPVAARIPGPAVGAIKGNGPTPGNPAAKKG